METKNQEQYHIVAENGVKEIIIRHGEAEILHEPVALDLQGQIDTPSRFVERRKDDLIRNKTHVIVNRREMKITLVSNEDNHFATFVTGRLIHNPDLAAFHINKDKSFTLQDWSNWCG